MVEFKEDVSEILPYNREQYIEYLDDNLELPSEWGGVSIQLYNSERKVDLKRYLKVYKSVFENAILQVDNGSSWIVNHEDKDLEWFPNDENSLMLLRTLFKQNNISKAFKGALVLKKDDLFNLTKDIISYPVSMFKEDGLLYKNLDVSNSSLPFIVKVTGHLNIDFLSTDKTLLEQVVNAISLNVFDVKDILKKTVFVIPEMIMQKGIPNKRKYYLRLLFLSLFLWSCSGNENIRNLKKVKIGMNIQEVKRIMGEPKDVFRFPKEEEVFRYVYEAPLASSDNIYILIGTTDSLVKGYNDGSE